VVARLLQEHAVAPFPARLRGEDVAGVDAVVLDADIVGCVETWLSNREGPPREHQRLLPELLEDVDDVVAALSDPEEVACCRRLRAMARAVLPRGR